MDDESRLDKRLLRRAFDKAAAGYDAAAVLQHEVCARMLSRLDVVKLVPTLILDAGCGTGNAIPGLRGRYPHAAICALDLAVAMTRRACERIGWWRRLRGSALLPVCGDIEHLPLRGAIADMVWSNLALQWSNEPVRAFTEIRRVLAPGGLLMFSTFGPHTLKELRTAYQGVDRYSHVNRFIDMHDLGDMLVHAGFADPVMDMETITLTYDTVVSLMKDLKAIGAHNVTAGRRAGMTARAALEAVGRNYETLRRDGRLPATFEIVYGHAWAPQPRMTADGRPIIPIKAGGS